MFSGTATPDCCSIPCQLDVVTVLVFDLICRTSSGSGRDIEDPGRKSINFEVVVDELDAGSSDGHVIRSINQGVTASVSSCVSCNSTIQAGSFRLMASIKCLS